MEGGKYCWASDPSVGGKRWINARLPRPSHPVAEGCWNPNMVQRIWKNRHKSAMAISPSCWGICKRHLWLPNSSSLLPQFLPKMAPWWAPCLMALGIILLIALYASMFAFLAYKYLTRGRWDPYWQGCLKMWVRSVVWKLLHWFVIIAISTGHCCHLSQRHRFLQTWSSRCSWNFNCISCLLRELCELPWVAFLLLLQNRGTEQGCQALQMLVQTRKKVPLNQSRC